MCKVNGHSWFTYMAQPWNARKLRNSKKRAAQLAAEREKAEALENQVTNEELATESATSVKANTDNKNDIGSLRVPLNTQKTGLNKNDTIIGLNLGA
jgi:hypothetical protein